MDVLPATASDSWVPVRVEPRFSGRKFIALTTTMYHIKYRGICVIYKRCLLCEVKNNNCYDIKIVHRYSVEILILTFRFLYTKILEELA